MGADRVILVERQAEVKALLEGMGNPAVSPADRYDKFRQLFWTNLSYNRVNTPLPRKGWPDAAAQALADDPLLFAAGAQDDTFHVIYARLASDKLLLGPERPVVSRLLRDHPYALFVFSTANRDRWHFLNVQYDDEIEKRRLFCRITVGPEECRHERLRTATERIERLDLGDRNPSAIELQNAVDEAFKVEAVTDEFFKEYASVFEDVEGRIKGVRQVNGLPAHERKRLFTQRLFNRLMFIAFIQKKGWLKFGNDTDYLNALWQDYQHGKKGKSNFYLERLKLLFFSGLNTASEINLIGINRGGFLKDVIGQVPYLNGGLFEEDEDDRDPEIGVPDECVNAIRRQLFNRFNFTVTESTPLDVEVAVDPEMLGKVFEELVTGRHETGSYYTPKPVVAFMCREALKGYLKTGVAKETPAAVEKFVDEHDPAGLRDAEAVLSAIKKVTVCDPACGSGAYLLGMLHELLALRACLFVTKNVDAVSTYQRKLEIIQNNVYGVDIDPFAVNIARLRLWLSLAVDFEGDQPPPLPNLDFKIEAGDSLTAPDPSGGLEQGFRKALIDEFLKQKAAFMIAHGSQKVALKKKITKLKQTITSWARSSGEIKGFDWAVEFAEIFVDDGFDVVVANPPFVNMVQMDIRDSHYRESLRHIFNSARGGFDLFVPFMERGLQLTAQDGMFVYIVPNKLLSAEYSTALREYFSLNAALISLTDLSRVPVFSAAVYPVIVLARKVKGDLERPSVAAYRADAKSLEDVNLVKIGDTPFAVAKQSGGRWSPLVDKVDGKDVGSLIASCRTLGELAEVSGACTVSEAYEWKAAIIDNGARLHRSNPKRYAPFIVSGNVRRFFQTWRDHNVQYIKDTYRTPVLDKKHKSVSPRRVRQIESYKIIVSGMSKRPTCVWDPDGVAAGKSTVVVIPQSQSDGPFLEALINSLPMSHIYKSMFGSLSLSGGYLRFGPPQLRALPIPNASHDDKVKIESLAKKCRDARGVDCEKWENEINERAAALYGL